MLTPGESNIDNLIKDVKWGYHGLEINIISVKLSETAESLSITWKYRPISVCWNVSEQLYSTEPFIVLRIDIHTWGMPSVLLLKKSKLHLMQILDGTLYFYIALTHWMFGDAEVKCTIETVFSNWYLVHFLWNWSKVVRRAPLMKSQHWLR